MLEKLKLVWDAFNGNKTVFGLALLQLAPHLPEPYQGYANLLGAILAGVGVTNRVVNMVTPSKAEATDAAK